MHLVLGLVRVMFKLEILQELWQHVFKDELIDCATGKDSRCFLRLGFN